MKQTALRSGASFWKATGPDPVTCEPLDGRVSCEVVVIGAGITGALVSDMLIRAGIDTVLVDQGDVGAGSTAASTGLLMYEVDVRLVDLIERVGKASAVHAYRRGLQAIAEIEQLASELGDQCAFVRRSALYFASDARHIPALQQEHECRQYFGFDVTFLNAGGLAELCGLKLHGALFSRGDAEVNPYVLTQSLVRRAQNNGLRAFAHTRFDHFEEGDSGVVVTTQSGRIEARHVVFATGYAARPVLPDSAADLKTSYVATSLPLPDISCWPDDCLMWETARPYFYLRRTPDGRAMIGGEDTPYSHDHQDTELLVKKAHSLAVRFRTLFPGSDFQPEYVWGGTFAETQDGLPFIGRATGHQRIYLALGYGGNGITFSMIAARLIKDLILEHPNADAEVFRFGR